MKNLYRELVNKYGTPLYVYQASKIMQRYVDLNEVFSEVNHEICYAVKANSNLGILNYIKSLGAGFDIVSGGELLRLLEIKVDPKKIVFSGVGKTEEEIELALNKEILMLNVESVAELNAVNRVAKRLNTIANVSLRVNPNISVDIHPYVATGLKSAKFGIPIEELKIATNLIKTEYKSLNLVGLDCHIGSGIVEVSPLVSAYQEMIKLNDDLRADGFKITHLDIGGGFGVSFSGNTEELDLKQLKNEVTKIFKTSPYKIIIEPGKFLITEAGELLTKVLYLKSNAEKNFIIVDAGMNDLMRPSLYEAYHKIELLEEDGGKIKRELKKFDIVGPVCETGCFLGHDRELVTPEIGDIMVVKDAGGYGFSMASNYNSRRLPAEVLVDESGAVYKLIRKREEYRDIWRDEVWE